LGLALLVVAAGGALTGYGLNLRYGPRGFGMAHVPESTVKDRTTIQVTRIRFTEAKEDAGLEPQSAPVILSAEGPAPSPVAAPEFQPADSVATSVASEPPAEL
jgi:hypothetical protein